MAKVYVVNSEYLAKFRLTQVELASMVGISRQTLMAIENEQRPMSWNTFLSLLFIFTKNEDTNALLNVLGILMTS